MKENGRDQQLVKRLLVYVKPYMVFIIISLLLLLGSVGTELFRPILIGQAVDEIISQYDKPYKIVMEPTQSSSLVKGFHLVEENQEPLEDEKYARILYSERFDNRYFLLPDVSKTELSWLKENKVNVKQQDSTFAIKLDGEQLQVFPLNSEEIKELRSEDLQQLLKITLIFIGILIIGLALNYTQTIILHYAGQKIIYRIRDQIFSHIQSLSIQFFNVNPVGKLVTRVTNDTETLNEMYTNVIVNSAKNVFMLLGISTMMFLLNKQLTLVVFTVVPVIIFATYLFRKYSMQAYREVRTRVAAINTFLSEHISGMNVVQIFSQEERKRKEFDDSNAKLKKAHMKQLVIFSIYRPSIYFMYVLSLTLILGYGGNKVLQDTMTIGTLIIFIQYIANFFSPIQELAEQYNILQSAMASAEKIFSILDEEVQIKEAEDAIPLKDVEGVIEFKNVWFAYDEEEWVLKDVSFKVNPGETVAFVGATGAGKTSILNLISRYFDIQKGEILLDGVNIKKYKLKSLRSHIGQMLQDVFIFNGTIRSNIRLRNKKISNEEIEKAAKYVNASHFIQKLPGKYDERVYERGATFSAGQRQLLSFARTLAFQPSILILDEATSNIDTETELLIQDALIKLMEDRTTLVVAHRLSTIQHADKIIVLHKGKIKEVGNHQELLAEKGLYYKLYQLQYQDIS